MNNKEEKIIIRDLRKEDLSGVKKLLDTINSILKENHEVNEKNLLSLFKDMHKVPSIYANYVALENNKIVGFLSLIFYKTFLHYGGTALINEIIVSEDHRNKGIGKNLIERAMKEAKLRGMDEIEVGTEKSNFLARQFYKNLGFNQEFILLGHEFNP